MKGEVEIQKREEKTPKESVNGQEARLKKKMNHDIYLRLSVCAIVSVNTFSMKFRKIKDSEKCYVLVSVENIFSMKFGVN